MKTTIGRKNNGEYLVFIAATGEESDKELAFGGFKDDNTALRVWSNMCMETFDPVETMLFLASCQLRICGELPQELMDTIGGENVEAVLIAEKFYFAPVSPDHSCHDRIAALYKAGTPIVYDEIILTAGKLLLAKLLELEEQGDDSV